MSTKIIVGLGNPGAKYDGTRHNVGFAVLDCLAQRLGVSINSLKWHALSGQAHVGGNKLILLKPQTYMNLSGQAVQEAAAFYKVPAEDILVVVDDVDIHLGSVRVRKKGSAGTHNGLRSIVSSLGSSDFARLKVAVGRRPARMDMADFVLSRFTDKEKPVMEEEIQAAVDALEQILHEGLDAAMNAWNGWEAPSVSNKSEEEMLQEKAEEEARAKQDEFRNHAKRCGD